MFLKEDQETLECLTGWERCEYMYTIDNTVVQCMSHRGHLIKSHQATCFDSNNNKVMIAWKSLS